MGEGNQVEAEETRQQSKQNHAEAQTPLLAALGFPQDLSQFVHRSSLFYLQLDGRRSAETECDQHERRRSEESGDDCHPEVRDKALPEERKLFLGF